MKVVDSSKSKYFSATARFLLDTLNDEQKDAVVYNDGPALIIAGPGSGKTRVLTHKIAYLIHEKRVLPDQILAVTFTNKAALEMQTRVVELLNEIRELDKTSKVIELRSKFGKSNETDDSANIKNDNSNADLENSQNASDDSDISFESDVNLDDSTNNDLDWEDTEENLSEDETVNSPQGEKERFDRLMLDDDGFEDIPPENFSTKTPQWIGTFHSLCARILRKEYRYIDVTPGFVIYDSDDSARLIKDILKELDISDSNLKPKSILSVISRAKGEMMGPKEFEDKAQNYFYQQVAKIYKIYQKKLRDNNALDFGDLLYETAKIFATEPAVLKKYQEMFKHLLIDEYQDTNKVQYFIVKKLAENHKNLTVVGDISQSIYSWRGADYRNMLQFERDYPKAKIFKLGRNYRSTKTILYVAQSVIENNKTHIPLDLYTDNPDGEKIRLYEAEHERAEAMYITDIISMSLQRHGGPEMFPEPFRYKNFAVLYRTNAQSRVIEEAFINAQIPYKIIGGMRFYDRKEIKDVLAYLKVFYNPKDTISWKRCVNTPTRGVGKKTLIRIEESKFDVDLIEEITKMPWKKYIKIAQNKEMTTLELLDTVLKDFGYLEYLDDGSEESLYRIENLKELRTVAAEFKDINEFLERVALVESSNKPDFRNDDAVILMTLHSAKGLEFDTVFLVGMEEGIFPHSRSMADEDELEEERRLCYVGITRAKKRLYLTYTRSRTLFGSTSSSIGSRFLGEIPEETIEFMSG